MEDVINISDQQSFEGYDEDHAYARAVFCTEDAGETLGGKAWIIVDVDGDDTTPSWLPIDEAERFRDKLSEMIEIAKRAEAGEIETLREQVLARRIDALEEDLRDIKSELDRLRAGARKP